MEKSDGSPPKRPSSPRKQAAMQRPNYTHNFRLIRQKLRICRMSLKFFFSFSEYINNTFANILSFFVSSPTLIPSLYETPCFLYDSDTLERPHNTKKAHVFNLNRFSFDRLSLNLPTDYYLIGYNLFTLTFFPASP